jgi:hypothetical protein
MQTPSQLARRSLIALVVLMWLPLCGAAADPSWIERSNRNSAMTFEALGVFDPEFASYVGIERFDSAVIDLMPALRPTGLSRCRDRARAPSAQAARAGRHGCARC